MLVTLSRLTQATSWRTSTTRAACADACCGERRRSQPFLHPLACSAMTIKGEIGMLCGQRWMAVSTRWWSTLTGHLDGMKEASLPPSAWASLLNTVH